MADQSFSIVDSHAHVWVNDHTFPWSPDAAATPSYDATPRALLDEMERLSVKATVLVQYIGYKWNNEYAGQAMASAPTRFAGVCRVNPEDPAAPDHMRYWTRERGFHGVRISPEPDSRGDWFSGPLMAPFFRRAGELGIPVVLLTKASRLPDLVKILERHREVDVVIDHLADCDTGNAEHMRCMVTLAKNPRVFLKTGHMWANSEENYPWHDQLSVLREMRDLFGASRIMWGSDWPLCRERTTYERTLTYIRDEATFLNREELTWVLGATAARLWKLAEQSSAANGSPPFANHQRPAASGSTEDV
jgi:L-fuconolactonase